MNISKAGRALNSGAADEADLELIRRFTRTELKPEEVYTFSVILCDNDIDRDYERFDEATLGALAELFVGKTGISDHEWRSGNQVARIYRTELLRDPEKKTEDGRDYLSLKAWAYMLRTEANADLIADIEGGIKKEVSVGCSVANSICSICGAPGGACSHIKGEHYDGKLCFLTLSGAADAYEWSFVAVPAQRGAGVTRKGLNPPAVSDHELAQLRKEAALGRAYLQSLREETGRLALICGKDLHEAIAPTLPMMEAEQLIKTKAALEKRTAELLPVPSQFPHGEDALRFDGTAYRV